MRTALTIAGSDSSGGAGIQADIKTMTMNGVYAMSAVTALTAQNTTGVTGIQESSPEFLRAQIDAVFSDIFPDAVKIGMVSSSELIHVIADSLKHWKARNIVVDPVMISTSGSKLINDDAVKTLADELLPIAVIATPNIPEAEILSGMKIADKSAMTEAARVIAERFGCAVLVKGGHMINDANDYLYVTAGDAGESCSPSLGKERGPGGEVLSLTSPLAPPLHMGGEQNNKVSRPEGDVPPNGLWFKGKRINTHNTHGTGCTLSSAIASNLAKGYSLTESVRLAKDYLSGALEAMLNLGHGCGPMMHNFNLTGKFSQ